MKVPPRNDLGYSRMRLERILSSRRLVFNPYKVSDSRLIEIAEKARLGDWFDLTDFSILRFTRLFNTNDIQRFGGVFFTTGAYNEEYFVPCSQIVYGITANDTCSRERSILGKRKLCNRDDVEKLVGKRVFLSRVIRGVNIRGDHRLAFRMHRLWGNPHRDAAIIREAACMAKIEMLERLLEYPESPDYLDCRKGMFDYEPRVRRAIGIISHYHEYPIPEDTTVAK